MPAKPPEGRKVKSVPAGALAAADRHERDKDYLSPSLAGKRVRNSGQRSRSSGQSVTPS
jgi:hypothetical protein